MTNRKMRFYNHICCSNIASSVMLLKLDISDFLSPLFFVNPAFSDLFFNLILHGVNPTFIVIGLLFSDGHVSVQPWNRFCYLFFSGIRPQFFWMTLPFPNLGIGVFRFLFFGVRPNVMKDQNCHNGFDLFILHFIMQAVQ